MLSSLFGECLVSVVREKKVTNRKMIKGSNFRGISNDILITFAKTRYRGKILERDERIILNKYKEILQFPEEGIIVIS